MHNNHSRSTRLVVFAWRKKDKHNSVQIIIIKSQSRIQLKANIPEGNSNSDKTKYFYS